MKQTLSEMATMYQVELNDYKFRFFSKWGYTPTEPTNRDFKFMNNKRQRMCQVFWEHKDVTRCISLIEALSVVHFECKSLRENVGQS
jgi:hypothetical protein